MTDNQTSGDSKEKTRIAIINHPANLAIQAAIKFQHEIEGIKREFNNSSEAMANEIFRLREKLK